MIWTEKYKPQSVQDIPQPEIVAAFLEAVKKKKPVLLLGPSGVGKTSLVYALAKEQDLEILELNASDFRDKASIESIAGASSKQASLFQKQKILLIDELDGISGQEDRGGIGAIVKVVEETRIPIVLIANNGYDAKFNDLRKKCVVLECERVSIKPLASILQDICVKEGIEPEREKLFSLAAKSNGDVRASINDLQTCIDEKRIDISALETRDQEETVFNVLKIIFKTSEASVALGSMDNVDFDLDEGLMFLDENLPLEYKEALDLQRAYECLAKADLFRGRIIRQQYWRLLVYQNCFMTAGVSCAKEKMYPGFISYKRSMRPLRIWQANMRLQKPKAMSEKFALFTHQSKKKSLQRFKSYKPMLISLQEELELSEEEVEYLRK